MGIKIRKTPEEKRAEELEKIQKQIEKRLKERKKFVEVTDNNWVGVTACDRYRMTPPVPSTFEIEVFMKSLLPRLVDLLADSKKTYVQKNLPPKLKGLSELTGEEIQILVKEGFRCIVGGIWAEGMPGGVWGKKCIGKKEAKEEAKRIKELLGW